ncbi:MAG: 2-isopropylmalate synthase, partial [Oscillospiraceae bacterium]|nr:2-isopropylmalate synthase [Oscillospiraceae bacterium]
QARDHLIRKTFEAIDGAKNVIVHFYNSTSELQRRVVFGMDMDGIVDIAVNGAKLIRQLADEESAKSGINIRYEYSPESFSGTEMDNAVLICEKVLDALGANEDNKVILNLPSTVEQSSPNGYADQIEYFCRNLSQPERAIISIHPHNDRGTAIAAAELGMLAGASRVEGTLFGNGERTGNVDIVTLALNMYTQGVDPKLELSDINNVREVYERTTKMHVHERHPYAGDLVFTAFSGSHQDAIAKGKAFMNREKCSQWQVPYIPIDPADIGREYDPIIRINSQSGKGGAAFIISENFGFHLPKTMHPEFGNTVKQFCDKQGTEISADAVYNIFKEEYLDVSGPYMLTSHKFLETSELNESSPHVVFEGMIKYNGDDAVQISGKGNGPIDAFFSALEKIGINGYSFVDYFEHAISIGSDAKAVSYIVLADKNGKNVFGVGMSHNINYASIRGVLCAINRSILNDSK